MNLMRLWRRADKRARGLIFALALLGSIPVAAAAPLRAGELSAAQAQLYTSVSIYPPSASAMTVCYGFVCRRREILNFTPGDRAALTQIMNSGHASAVADATVRRVTGRATGGRRAHVPAGDHVHLGERHCLEVSILRGPGHDVIHLGDELLATKGVLHGEITFTSGEGALNKLQG